LLTGFVWRKLDEFFILDNIIIFTCRPATN
jgi:hypothetical protein